MSSVGSGPSEAGQASEPIKAPEADKPAEGFRDRFGKAWQALIAGLAAVGSFAVLNLAFDKLGRGPAGGIRLFEIGGIGFALFGMVLFVLGVLIVVSTTIWLTNASRVSWAYLNRTDWRARIPKRIREELEAEDSPYMSPFTSLQDLGTKYRAEQKVGRTKRGVQMRERIATILDFAALERTRLVSPWALATALLGSLILTVGVWMFLVNVNAADVLRADEVTGAAQEREDQLREATQAREDQLRLFPSGEVIPRTPSEVTLLIPSGAPAQEWVRALGEPCLVAQTQPSLAYNKVESTLIDTGTSPSAGAPVGGSPQDAVYEIVTHKTESCNDIAVGWVPPAWVVARSSTATSTSSAATATSASSQSPSGG